MNGGGGFDFVDYGRATRRLRIHLGKGTAFGDGRDRLVAIEGALGGDRADRLVGDRHENEFYGEKGNDTIEGRGGNDLLHGGPGTDDVDGGTGRNRCVAAEIRSRCD